MITLNMKIWKIIRRWGYRGNTLKTKNRKKRINVQGRRWHSKDIQCWGHKGTSTGRKKITGKYSRPPGWGRKTENGRKELREGGIGEGSSTSSQKGHLKKSEMGQKEHYVEMIDFKGPKRFFIETQSVPSIMYK